MGCVCVCESTVNKKREWSQEPTPYKVPTVVEQRYQKAGFGMQF